MKRNPYIAGILSLLVPGLGQIYGGKGNKGVAIIVAAIVIGNLNIIVMLLIVLVNSVMPHDTLDSCNSWTVWIPRFAHDVVSFWSIAFWILAVADAFSISSSP